MTVTRVMRYEIDPFKNEGFKRHGRQAMSPC
jgi:hypothetical protein